MDATFTITGTVSRKPYTSEKFGRLSLLVSSGSRKAYHDVKAFDLDVIAAIRQLGEGEQVTVKGELMSEQLKDSDKNPIKVANRDVWVTALKATSVQLAGDSSMMDEEF